MDSIDQFLFRRHPDFPQHGAGHLAEEILGEIQPGAMFGNEYEFKALGFSRQITLCLFGDVSGMIIQNQAQRLGRRVGSIQFGQECYEVTALVGIAHNLGDDPSVQIEASQK